VFVGGCTTGLFITDPAAGGIRPTKDVDEIVSTATGTPQRDVACPGHGARFAGSSRSEF